MSESDVQKAILDYLQYSGHYAQRINSGAAFGTYKNKGGAEKVWKIKGADAGTPDILACINGKFVGLEVKADEKVKKAWQKKVELFQKTSFPSDYHRREINQYKAIERIKKAGGEAYVVCSLDEVIQIVKNLT